MAKWASGRQIHAEMGLVDGNKFHYPAQSAVISFVK